MTSQGADMQIGEITSQTFGHIIAFMIPGFILIWALSLFSPTLASWLGSAEAAATVGGFFFATVASVVAGLFVSALRVTCLDSIHHHTGVPLPKFDYSKLQANKDAFLIVIEQLYRYYQFHANTFIAVILAYIVRLISIKRWPWGEPLLAIPVLGFELVLFVASRQSLSRSYLRLGQVLGITT